MKLFVGLDVSLEKTAICVIRADGMIVKEAQAAGEPEALTRWIGQLDATIAAIGLEAGPLSQWLHRGLTGAGLDVVLMETRQVQGALTVLPIKTDRRDAEGIARSAPSGLVPSGLVPAGPLSVGLSTGGSRGAGRAQGRATGVHRVENVPAWMASQLRPRGRHTVAWPV
jgi:hypothetical protein